MRIEMLTAGQPSSGVKDKCAMGIMIKTPRKGFSKTRLSPPFSLQEAANMSRCFLKDTSATIEALSRVDPFVVGVAIYTPVGSEGELQGFLSPDFKMIAQRDVDFGDRLWWATQDLFSVGFAAVCLINSDSPTLPMSYLHNMAISLKETKDQVVLGRSLDGGYYTLGARRSHQRLFQDIAWNTSQVYDQTIEKSNEINLPIVTLPAWYDVDDQRTLNRLLSELFPERANEKVPRGSPAPNTKEFLNRILLEEGAGRIWRDANILNHRDTESTERNL
jgi:uncharacterized protein